MKSRKLFKIDERTVDQFKTICTFSYLITMAGLVFVLFIKPSVMNNMTDTFEVINIITTINVIFLISAILYYGLLPIEKIDIVRILLGYLIFVIIGFIVVVFKYNVLSDFPMLISDLFREKFIIVAGVSGLLALFFVIFTILGKRKMEKELE